MITISDIAEKAGVSRGTVDRVIHNRKGVSSDNIEKVKQAMDELNYQPNIFARGLSLSKSFTFGVLMPDSTFDVKYWELPKNGIDRAQASLHGYKVQIKYYSYDLVHRDSLHQAFKNVLNDAGGLDGLLLTGSSSEEIKKFVSKIPKTLPFVFFDTRIPDTDFLSFIGTDSFKSGQLAGRLIHLCLKDLGKIVVLRLKPENYEIENRVEGFLNYFKQYPEFELEIHDADREQDKYIFTQLTKKLLEKNEHIDAFFIPNSAANEVAEAAQFYSSKRKIHIIGYDLTEENCYFLKSGTIDFLINRRPELQGYRGITTLFRHVVNRQKVEKHNLMPFDIVTRENVDFYLAEFI